MRDVYVDSVESVERENENENGEGEKEKEEEEEEEEVEENERGGKGDRKMRTTRRGRVKGRRFGTQNSNCNDAIFNTDEVTYGARETWHFPVDKGIGGKADWRGWKISDNAPALLS
uniref:Uncharacterized protein n=1 Tax=Vespula pensylvanica TaxID=30213 RepID=A0A834MZ75_VESPE|nr:hypothetical protein H0235_017689 [Vespula pensylvanica]